MLRLVHKLRASRFSLKFLFLLCNNPSTSHVEIFNHNFNKNLSSLVNGWLMKVFEASSLSLKHCLSLECTLGNYRLLSLSIWRYKRKSLFIIKTERFFFCTHTQWKAVIVKSRSSWPTALTHSHTDQIQFKMLPVIDKKRYLLCRGTKKNHEKCANDDNTPLWQYCVRSWNSIHAQNLSLILIKRYI